MHIILKNPLELFPNLYFCNSGLQERHAHYEIWQMAALFVVLVMETNILKLNNCKLKLNRVAWSPAYTFWNFEKVFWLGPLVNWKFSAVWTTDIICAKMIWGFLLPGVLVALLRSWHAAPSRDETVLLASYQRPADWGHVSARLSVNNCSSLPSSSLGSFYSFSVSRFLSLTSRTLSIPLVSSVLLRFTFFPSFIWLPSWISFSLLCSSSSPTLCLCLFFLALADTLQSGWLVQLISNSALPVSHEWGEANADQSFIIPPKGTTLTNHSTSRLLSGQDWKRLQLQNPTRQNSHSELCQRKTTHVLPKKKKEKKISTSFTS